MTTAEAARRYVAAGMSVIPVPTGTKKPSVSWLPFQLHPPTPDEIDRLFASCGGIGVVCGEVSGWMEAIDFDDLEAFPKWEALLTENGYGDLLGRLLVQATPSGGRHVVYRCPDGIDGNQPLARREVGGRLETAIETRGKGGYILVGPTRGYRKLRGDWKAVPEIDFEERDALLSAARFFNESVQSPYSHKGPEGIKRPGDDFGAKNSWEDVLGPAGWVLSHERGGEGYWVRPGKNRRDGVSGTTNYAGSDLFKCFTTNGHPFRSDCTYTKFAAYAFIHYGGDMQQAARELGRQGYGAPVVKPKYTGSLAESVQEGRQKARTAQRWTRAADVTEKATEWLVEPYIPLGEITLVAGDPGDGKSTLSQAIVSHVTQGTPINGIDVPRGDAVFLSAEQSVNSVTVPRFRQIGADLDRIVLPDEADENDEPVPFVLDEAGISELRQIVIDVRPKVIVVDTITAYIEAQRDFHTANSVREWMRRLADIARVGNCAVICITHLNKAQGQKAIYRVMGSADFVGASRSVLLVGKDPDNNDVRAAAHIKSNVGPIGKPLGFSIKGGIFGWEEGVDLNEDRMFEAPATKEARTRGEKCAVWLRGFLSVPQTADDVIAAGKANGFSRNACYEAKAQIGAIASKDGFAGGWCWHMPKDEQAESWANRY